MGNNNLSRRDEQDHVLKSEPTARRSIGQQAAKKNLQREQQQAANDGYFVPIQESVI